MPETAGPLLEQLRGNAAAAAAEAVARARAEADAIRARARDRARRERIDAMARHDRDAAAALSRARAETASRVGRDTLAARAAALDRIFVEAERRLASLATNPGLPEVLARTVNDGLTYLPDGAASVACASAVAGAVRAIVAATGRADVAVRIDERVPMGVIVEAGDRSVVVDGTLARCVSRDRPHLAAEVARRIAEQSA